MHQRGRGQGSAVVTCAGGCKCAPAKLNSNTSNPALAFSKVELTVSLPASFSRRHRCCCCCCFRRRCRVLQLLCRRAAAAAAVLRLGHARLVDGPLGSLYETEMLVVQKRVQCRPALPALGASFRRLRCTASHLVLHCPCFTAADDASIALPGQGHNNKHRTKEGARYVCCVCCACCAYCVCVRWVHACCRLAAAQGPLVAATDGKGPALTVTAASSRCSV